METDQKIELIPFFGIKTDHLFHARVILFKKSVMINLDASGIHIISLEVSEPANFGINYYQLFIPTLNKENKRKQLSMVVNNKGQIEYSVFFTDENNRKIGDILFSSDKPVEMEKFIEIFPEIVEHLR